MPFELDRNRLSGHPRSCGQTQSKLGLPDVLGKRFFSERSAKPSISIFKGMDAFAIQMGYAGTGRSGQGELTGWRRFVELLGVGRHFRGDPP